MVAIVSIFTVRKRETVELARDRHVEERQNYVLTLHNAIPLHVNSQFPITSSNAFSRQSVGITFEFSRRHQCITRVHIQTLWKGLKF